MVSMPDIADHQIWMVVVGFIIAFALAFGIGANDVANSFGTSVGAKVLTMRQACILASIFETLGAILLGAKVSDTIRKGIIDIEPYRNDTDLLMVGNVAALSGSCVWLIAATLLRMPVSATHSIVGATVGFALVAHGSRGINWAKLGMIIGSWFISPVAAGFVSTLLFYVCRYFILSKEDPLEPGLKVLPVFYATTVVVNLFSVFYDGPEMLGFDKIPIWGAFIISFGAGTIVAIVVRFAIVPWQRRKIKAHCTKLLGEEAKKLEEEVEVFPRSHSYTGKDGGGDRHEKQPLNLTVMDPLQDGDDVSQDGHTTKCTPHIGASNIMPPTASSRILTEITYPHGEKRRMSWGRRTSESERQRRASESERKRHHSESERTRHCSESEAIKAERVRHKSDGGRNRSQSECDPRNEAILEDKENERNILNIETIPEGNGSTPEPVKPAGIDKTENAPLMDNEYKLGSSTPTTCGTQEDVNSCQKQNGLSNKPVVAIATPNNNNSRRNSASSIEKGQEPDELEAGRSAVTDRPETGQLFSFLQILTAVFGSFAHGGNDVSNAIGPVVSLWLTATTSSVAAKASTPIWILLYGGVGISLGLWIWGRRVIKTLGEDLTKITPSSGFCIEIGSALTVLIASNVGIPISTTHCKVGSVVCVGRFRARENVDWSIFRNIVLAWLVTLPVTGGISAAMMAGLKLAI